MSVEVEALKRWRAQVTKKDVGLNTRGWRGTPLEVVRERHRPFWRRKRFLASVVFGVSNLIPGGSLILKLARTVPVLIMMHGNGSP